MKKIELGNFPDFKGKRKLLLTMKLTLIILLACFMQVSATVYSQSTKFNFDVKNKRIVDVLREIEDNSNFRFFYQREQVDVEKKVDLNTTDETVEEILPELFAGQEISFDVRQDNLILIKPTGYENNVPDFFEQQQQRTVSGTVTDNGGQPLPGVTVVVKGTTQGTVTNTDGEFSLTNIPEDATLVFSFVGMRTQEVVVGSQTRIDVRMEEEKIGIEEVVAIGYGTARKGDLTGSVATVSTQDFNKVPATTLLQVLQGRASGLQITTNSGLPGAGADVLIRGVQSINGSTSPIYVVDGVITDGISNINPNSIESVSVLKDASAAAIYGARAANGVILISTKRGAGKREIEISLNAYYGLQTESNLKLKLLNAEQFFDLWTEAYNNAGIDVPWNNEILTYYNGVDTNWKDLMMQTGSIQNYDLSVSGGSENSNYFISSGFLDQKGMIIETAINKYTLTFNSDHNIKDVIKFGNSLNLYSTTTEGNGYPYEIALRKVPLTRAYEDNGDYGIQY